MKVCSKVLLQSSLVKSLGALQRCLQSLFCMCKAPSVCRKALGTCTFQSFFLLTLRCPKDIRDKQNVVDRKYKKCLKLYRKSCCLPATPMGVGLIYRNYFFHWEIDPFCPIRIPCVIEVAKHNFLCRSVYISFNS